MSSDALFATPHQVSVLKMVQSENRIRGPNLFGTFVLVDGAPLNVA